MNLPFDSSEMIVAFTAGGVWLLIGWLFVLGAAMGSFLNVVAYRLPRGMSLSRPGSRCPACGRPIRWHDNVPIFGWLVLGGRCRDCRTAISPRYPIVEMSVAASSALVAWSAIGPVAGAEGGESFALDPLSAVFRLMLVYTLICAALLEFDGGRAPRRLLIAIFVAGVVLSTVCPDVRPVQSASESAWRGLYDSGWMLAAALLLGALAWPLLVEKADDDAVRAGTARVAELALAGVFLGLWAMAAIAVFSPACFLATRIAGRFWPPAARFGWAAALVLGTLIWIAAGREMIGRLPSVFRGDPRMTLLAAGAMVAVLSIVGRLAHSGPTSSDRA